MLQMPEWPLSSSGSKADFADVGLRSPAIRSHIYPHLTPNMPEGVAAAVDGALRAAINKRAEDVGQQIGKQSGAKVLVWSVLRFKKPNGFNGWKGGRVV
jgi:hypothetical protein